MNSRTNSVILAVPRHVRIRKVHNEALLLDLKSGNSFGLNAMGVKVWEGIVAHGNLSSVIELLRDEYEEDSGVLESNVQDLVEQLMAHGLLLASEQIEP